MGCRESEKTKPAAREVPASPPASPDGLPSDASLQKTTSPEIAVGNLNGRITELERRLETRPEQTHLYPTLIAALLSRAQFLAKYGDYDRAVEIAEKYVSARAGDKKAYLARARVRASLHKFAQALSDLDKARGLGAHESEIRQVRMPILSALGKIDEAFALREELATAYPGFETLAMLAVAHVSRLETGEAESKFREALAASRTVSPFKIAWLCFQWGRMYEKGGKNDKARAMYELAYKRLPQYAEAAGHLAGMLAMTGDTERAKTLLTTLVATTDNPEYVGQLAGLENRLGNRDRAAELVTRATAGFESLLARHPEAFADHAARYYLNIGNNTTRALALAKDNLAVRRSHSALTLALEAALRANATEYACPLAQEATGLSYPPERLLFQAWRAFQACGRTELASELARRLGIDKASAP